MSTKRPYLIVGNWKMYKTSEQAVADARAIVEGLSAAATTVDVGIAPHALALEKVARAVRTGDQNPLRLYAQHGHAEDEGAFTGEISFAQLQSCVDGVLIGHSERRHFFGETDAQVQSKAMSAGRLGLPALVCIGETKEEREDGKTDDVVRHQLAAALDGFVAGAGSSEQAAALLDIAYEPVWAISRGDASVQPASVEDVAAMHHLVRTVLQERLGAAAASVRILYGGSVKPDNAAALLALPDVQGALVGGASLEPASFLAIVRSLPATA